MWLDFNIVSRLRKYYGKRQKSECSATVTKNENVITDRSLHVLHTALSDALEKSPSRDENEVKLLVSSVMQTDRKFTRLGDILARWHLAHDRPDEALKLLENLAIDKTSSIRLIANTCRCIVSRRTEAFIDLHHWLDEPSCPVSARTLYAMLQVIDNDNRQIAVQTLIQNIKQIADPVSIQLLVIINVEAGRVQEANYWAGKLSNTITSWINHNHDHDQIWLNKLGLNVNNRLPQPPDYMVDVLAIELEGDENLIPSLVACQYHKPDDSSLQLLRLALEKALPELEQQSEALEALARLAIIARDYPSARKWIIQGLDRNPLSVPLAIMLSELTKTSGQDYEAGNKRNIKADDITESLTVVFNKEHSAYNRHTTADKSVVTSNSNKNSTDENDNTMRKLDDTNPEQILFAVAKAHPDWPDLQKLVQVMEAA